MTIFIYEVFLKLKVNVLFMSIQLTKFYRNNMNMYLMQKRGK